MPFIAFNYSSLLSLDRDDTDEEDYKKYCETCFAAELEEELDG